MQHFQDKLRIYSSRLNWSYERHGHYLESEPLWRQKYKWQTPIQLKRADIVATAKIAVKYTIIYEKQGLVKLLNLPLDVNSILMMSNKPL